MLCTDSTLSLCPGSGKAWSEWTTCGITCGNQWGRSYRSQTCDLTEDEELSGLCKNVLYLQVQPRWCFGKGKCPGRYKGKDIDIGWQWLVKCICILLCAYHWCRKQNCYSYNGIGCAHRQQTSNWPLIVPQINCCAYAVIIENMCITFIPVPNKLETTMTSQGHVTTASLKQANKEYTEGISYVLASQKFLHIHPWKLTQNIERP